MFCINGYKVWSLLHHRFKKYTWIPFEYYFSRQKISLKPISQYIWNIGMCDVTHICICYLVFVKTFLNCEEKPKYQIWQVRIGLWKAT